MVEAKASGRSQKPSLASKAGQESVTSPLHRYMVVLELVSAFPDALILTDVSTLLGLPKTTAHRLLSGLARVGLVEGGGRSSRFKLGDRLIRLMHNSAVDGWISALAQPHLEVVNAKLGETSFLARIVGHRILVVTSESPEVHWRSYVQPNIEMAPHAAASAKAILAFQTEAIVAKALAEPLPRLTAYTNTDPDAVRAIYAQAREDGFATCVSEIDEGLGGLAVPVIQAGNRILYSLGVTGPVQRIMDDGLENRIAVLKEVSIALAKTLSAGSAIAARTQNPA